MKVLALVSGGKDSVFSMMEAVGCGHDIVALAHLTPPEGVEELDSWMFQSVGSTLARAIGDCMGLPMYTAPMRPAGSARNHDDDDDDDGMEGEEGEGGQEPPATLAYTPQKGDEVEVLFDLVASVLAQHPDVKGLCSGAILSDYQRLRVESVCSRLSLVSIAPLWQANQSQLLQRMIDSGMEAVLTKVAGMGLDPHKHLGKSLRQMQPTLERLHSLYGSHVCGEGGEFESSTLWCPLFRKRIVIDQQEVLMHSDDMFAPVGLLKINAFHLEDVGHSAQPHADREPEAEPALVAFPGACSVVPVSRSGGLHPTPPGDNVDAHSLAGECAQGSLSCGSASAMVWGGNARAEDLQGEARHVLERMGEVLKERCGASWKDVVLVHLFVSDMSLFQTINAVYVQFMPPEAPSRVCVQLSQACLLRVSCLCSNLPRKKTIHVQSISPWAPACIGPYAQSVCDGRGVVHTAGSIALVPSSLQMIDVSELAEPQPWRVETRKALLNFQPVLDLATAAYPPTKCHGGILRAELYIREHDEQDAVAEAMVDEWCRWLASASDGPWSRACMTLPFVSVVPRLPRDARVEVSVSLQPFFPNNNNDGNDSDNDENESEGNEQESPPRFEIARTTHTLVQGGKGEVVCARLTTATTCHATAAFVLTEGPQPQPDAIAALLLAATEAQQGEAEVQRRRWCAPPHAAAGGDPADGVVQVQGLYTCWPREGQDWTSVHVARACMVLSRVFERRV